MQELAKRLGSLNVGVIDASPTSDEEARLLETLCPKDECKDHKHGICTPTGGPNWFRASFHHNFMPIMAKVRHDRPYRP